MAGKVLATCVVAFIVSALVLRWFGDSKKNHAWEVLPAMLVIAAPVVGIVDVIYLIWR